MNEPEYSNYLFFKITDCNMCGNDSYRVLGRRLNKSQGFNPSGKVGLTTTIVQCTSCELIYSNPMPIPSSLEDHYNIDPAEYWREDYFKVDENYFSTEIEWLKKLTDGKPHLKTLDIGAGLGKQMVALKRAGYEAYGFEPSPAFYSMAKEKFNFGDEFLKLSSIEDADYSEEFFDFISFGAVIEHLKNPSHSISKAIKWLKRGGIIHIEVPNSEWLISRLINKMYKLRGKDYVSNLSPMHPPYHLYEFNLKSFVKNGQINNYTVIDHTYYVGDTFLPKAISPLARKLMKNTKTGMQLCVWLQKKN